MSADLLHEHTPFQQNLLHCRESILEQLSCFCGNIDSILGGELHNTRAKVRSKIATGKQMQIPAIDSSIEAFLTEITKWIEAEEKDYEVDEFTYEDLQELMGDLRRISACVRKKIANPNEKVFDKEEPKDKKTLLFYRSLADLLELGYTEQVNKISRSIEQLTGMLGWAVVWEDLDTDEE